MTARFGLEPPAMAPARDSALSLELAPTADPAIFLAPDGTRHRPPSDWAFLPRGDAMWTRRVKAAGASWTIVEKRGRKRFSRGVWAPKETIERVRLAIEAERATTAYAKKRAAGVLRREREQTEYVATFEAEIERFLGFSREWQLLARALAKRVAAHATPVGSGTVARTQRIPVSERAEAAVLAWMRHHTTAYDAMHVPRVRGARRRVRRELASVSRGVLDRHRKDVPHAIAGCSLCTALTRGPETAVAAADLR